jgi:hypothetical protein
LRTKVSTKRRSLEIYLTQCGTKNDFTVFWNKKILQYSDVKKYFTWKT